MRLVPQSMFMRLTLILIAVLFLVQLWSAALHFQDRGQDGLCVTDERGYLLLCPSGEVTLCHSLIQI